MLIQKKNNLILFIEAYTCWTKIGQGERQKLIKHFNAIDSNHNGLIELGELKRYFVRNKIDLNDEQIAGILQRIDLNQNEKIDLNEFICALSNLQRYYGE